MGIHLHRIEHLNYFLQSPCECIEFTEDVHFTELKLTFIRHLFELLLRLVEAALQNNMILLSHFDLID